MPLAETLVRSQTDGKAPSRPSGLVEDRFHQLPHVVSARAGDATVLMDRKRGSYFTLNEVGGRVWELVGAGSTTCEVVERLLEEYDVSREQLEGDVTATLQQLISDRLITLGRRSNSVTPSREPAKPAPRGVVNNREVRVPSVLQCGLTIFTVKVMLTTRGFGWTIDWLLRRVDEMLARTDLDAQAASATEHRVAVAAALYPGRALCLEQSLALYYLLKRHGIQVRLRLGVVVSPFRAHAWVEHNGQPLNENAETTNRYVMLPDVLP